MTFGEFKYRWKRDSRVVNGKLEFDETRAPKRMPKDECVRYYTVKLKRAWLELGYKKGEKLKSVKQKEPETKGFTVEEEPTAQTTVKEVLSLLPDWESDDIDLTRYAKDTRGTITLGALMEFGKACIEAHEKRKGLKAVAFEVAKEVA